MTYLAEGLPKPAPSRDGFDAPYWQGTLEGKLVVQRCADCQTWQWGPEWLCHECHSFDMTWQEISQEGVIYSWERVWHPVHPSLQDSVPYIVVLVELPQAGNIRMIGNLLGDPMQEVTIGSSVKAVFEKHEDEDPAFALVHWQA